MLQAYINNRQGNRLTNYLMNFYENVPIIPNTFNQLKKNNVIRFSKNMTFFLRDVPYQIPIKISEYSHYIYVPEHRVVAFIERIHYQNNANNARRVDIRIIPDNPSRDQGLHAYLQLTKNDLQHLLLYSPNPPKRPKTPNRRK